MPHCPFAMTGRLEYVTRALAFVFVHSVDVTPSKHLKTHQEPTKCPVPSCEQYCKDISKHCKDKHPEFARRTVHFCPHPYCKHSVGRGKGFPRLNNLKRHISSQHGGVGLDNIVSVTEDPYRLL